MQLDGRTLLFSTAVSLTILALIIWSIRRSIRDAVQGLGHFSGGNLLLTVACILLSLRGAVPDWASLWLGNVVLIAASAQYLQATLCFDDRSPGRWLEWLAPAIASLHMAAFMVVVDHQPARVIGIMGLLVSCCGIAAFSLLRAPRSLSSPRMVTGASFLVVAVAGSARIVAVVAGSDQQAGLYSRSTSGTAIFVAACIVSQTGAVGYILMVNERIRDRLAHAASHDALTGVLTRGAFLELARRELVRSEREGWPFAVLMADIDHFKRINDSHGHQTGDQALTAFGRVASACLRGTDVIGRYGGEEFIGLLPNASAEQARQVAERLRTAVAAHRVDTDDGPIDLSCSIGVADSTTFGWHLDGLIAAADRAMYAAKAGGRNQVQIAAQRPEAGLEESRLPA